MTDAHAQEEGILRVAARYGLKPADVYGMTWREVEIWIDGAIDRECDMMEMVAGLVVAPLLQPHSKTPVRAARLLPRSVTKRQRPGRPQAPTMEAGADLREMARAQQRQRAEQRAAAWWEGPEGRALRDILKEP